MKTQRDFIDVRNSSYFSANCARPIKNLWCVKNYVDTYYVERVICSDHREHKQSLVQTQKAVFQKF